MISTEQIQDMLGRGGGTLVGKSGDKLGKVGQVFVDDETGKPEWVTVSGRMFGGESFVPLSEATLSGSEITVPFDKAKVKGAPKVSSADGHISADEEAELYRYYGMNYSTSRSDSGLPAGDRKGQVGYDTSGQTTDDAMTRSEEQLKVGTEKAATGKARLRKFVVTEQRTATVPVTREEVRLEREPITEANIDKATSGPDISEAEHEVALHEERPVVEKEVVPVERVRLGKEQVTEQQQVTEEVRKEQIESDTSDVAEVSGKPKTDQRPRKKR